MNQLSKLTMMSCKKRSQLDLIKIGRAPSLIMSWMTRDSPSSISQLARLTRKWWWWSKSGRLLWMMVRRRSLLIWWTRILHLIKKTIPMMRMNWRIKVIFPVLTILTTIRLNSNLVMTRTMMNFSKSVRRQVCAIKTFRVKSSRMLYPRSRVFTRK